MHLRVIREPSTPGGTFGALYVDGVWLCWTLEDRLREGPKVPGDTAIPAGSYPVVLSMSARFRKTLPEVQNVPGFSGIRIHSGNTAQDTEGCLLVGQTRISTQICYSKQALEALMTKLQASVAANKSVTIHYENPPTY